MKHRSSCPLCNSREFTPFLVGQDIETLQPGDFTIGRCVDCGFCYLSNIPDGDEIDRFYPHEYGAYNISMNVGIRLYSKLLGVFLNHGMTTYFDIPILRPFGNRKMLDIGCGSGYLLKAYKEAGWDISGVDFSDLMVGKANAMLGGAYCVKGNAERPIFSSQGFDLITVSQVLEHLENPLEALLNWRNLLRNDGKIIVAVPNFMSLNRKLFGKWWYGGLSLPRHFNHFSVGTLSHILEKSGFYIQSIKCVPYPSFVNSLMLKFGKVHRDVSGSVPIRLLNSLTIPWEFALSKFNLADGLLVVASGAENR